MSRKSGLIYGKLVFNGIPQESFARVQRVASFGARLTAGYRINDILFTYSPEFNCAVPVNIRSVLALLEDSAAKDFRGISIPMVN